MKDENIKEILELLKEDLYIPQEDNREYKLLNKGDDKLLLDYITNLQEENEYSNYCNEELRKKITNLEYKIKLLDEENKRLTELDENYPIEEQLEEALKYETIYKSRNEKAIAYINAGKTFDDIDVGKVVNKIQNNLLNILQGDDKDE